MKTAKGASIAEASSVLEEVVSEAATNLPFEVVGEKNQAASDVVESDITGNNMNSIYKDCFYSSTLNHISATPSPKPSPRHTPSPIPNIIQHLEHMMDSPYPTLIIQVLENVMNLVDSKHPAGETTADQRILAYISNSEQTPPLNTMIEPLINVFCGKTSSSSSSYSNSDLIIILGLYLYLSNLSKLSLLISSTHKMT